MIKTYTNETCPQLILPVHTDDGQPQLMQRQTVCGSREARALGLQPMEEYPDHLLDMDNLEAMIGDCHAYEIFPRYHQARSGWPRQGWNQKSWGYCWTYSLSACCMDLLALEFQAGVRLSPHSLGWLVGWQNKGFYLDEAIHGARTRGIASVEYVPEYQTNVRQFKTGWEQDAMRYRPLEWWDTEKRSDEEMLRYCASGLSAGKPCYIAYWWWGHAVELVALRYSRTSYLNVVWQIRNSHGEEDLIELDGSRGVPDECFIPRSMSLPFVVGGQN